MKAKINKIKIKAQTISPHEWNGIIIPVEIKHKQNKLIGLVIKFVIKKNLKSKLTTPASMHKISSGKRGKNIIKKNAYFPCCIFCCKEHVLSLPMAQYSTFKPKIRPRKNANTLPSKIASVLNTKAIGAPNIITPTIVEAKAGMGKMVTCKNCKTTKTQ